MSAHVWPLQTRRQSSLDYRSSKRHRQRNRHQIHQPWRQGGNRRHPPLPRPLHRHTARPKRLIHLLQRHQRIRHRQRSRFHRIQTRKTRHHVQQCRNPMPDPTLHSRPRPRDVWPGDVGQRTGGPCRNQARVTGNDSPWKWVHIVYCKCDRDFRRNCSAFVFDFKVYGCWDCEILGIWAVTTWRTD